MNNQSQVAVNADSIKKFYRIQIVERKKNRFGFKSKQPWFVRMISIVPGVTFGEIVWRTETYSNEDHACKIAGRMTNNPFVEDNIDRIIMM